MRALTSNDYAMMVSRLADCRLGTTRLGVTPPASQTLATVIANPSRNLKWTPSHPFETTTAWTVDKS